MTGEIDPPQFEPTAAVYNWRGRWIFASEVRYRGGIIDEDGYQVATAEQADAATLGTHLRAALAASRMVSLEQMRAYLQPDAVKERYERWVGWCLRFTGATNRRALFRGFRHCGARVVDGGLVRLSPFRRHGAEGWSSTGEYVQCRLSDSDEALGLALRDAIERSIA